MQWIAVCLSVAQLVVQTSRLSLDGGQVGGLTDEPTAFHVQPYLQWPDRDAMTVMWETAEPSIGVVRYGPTRETELRATEPEARRLHEVRLTGLAPGSRYFYRVESGAASSEVSSFRTAPDASAPKWRLAVYGDSRSFPDRHRQVADLIDGFNPDLIVHTGDQVTRGTQRPLWKSQFFDPAARLFSRVPVVTSLGNHEEQAGNYFEYLALPGNERFFSFQFGNAHVVNLDSNTWGNSARDSKQYAWLKEDLSRPRRAKWTIVTFHHPLFSAHDKRSINRARWDWCPLFEEWGVDLVLTGHDHFYYRSWPIGRLAADGPSRGITHITTAGGGAPLYQMKMRSYTAVENSVHHASILDFTDVAITGEVVDLAGKRVDEFRITKQPTLAAEFCAYEVYELERAIRQAIESRPPVNVAEPVGQAADGGRQPAEPVSVSIQDELVVPHTFRVPVRARLEWTDAELAGLAAQQAELKPGEPLRIALSRSVSVGPGSVTTTGQTGDTPRMKLTFSDVRFRNRVIEFDPLKLWRPVTVRSRPITFGANTRGPAGRDTHALVRSDARGAARVPADVVFAHNANELIATVRVQDPKVAVAEKTPVAANDQAGLLKRQHLRLVIADSKQTFTFVVSPGGERGDARNGDWAFDESRWSATSHRQGDAWLVTFTVPRERLGDLGRLRVNLVHANPTADVEDCLSPTFDAGSDPDRVPDFRFGDRSTDQFAKLVVD